MPKESCIACILLGGLRSIHRTVDAGSDARGLCGGLRAPLGCRALISLGGRWIKDGDAKVCVRYPVARFWVDIAMLSLGVPPPELVYRKRGRGKLYQGASETKRGWSWDPTARHNSQARAGFEPPHIRSGGGSELGPERKQYWQRSSAGPISVCQGMSHVHAVA